MFEFVLPKLLVISLACVHVFLLPLAVFPAALFHSPPHTSTLPYLTHPYSPLPINPSPSHPNKYVSYSCLPPALWLMRFPFGGIPCLRRWLAVLLQHCAVFFFLPCCIFLCFSAMRVFLWALRCFALAFVWLSSTFRCFPCIPSHVRRPLHHFSTFASFYFTVRDFLSFSPPRAPTPSSPRFPLPFYSPGQLKYRCPITNAIFNLQHRLALVRAYFYLAILSTAHGVRRRCPARGGVFLCMLCVVSSLPFLNLSSFGFFFLFLFLFSFTLLCSCSFALTSFLCSALIFLLCPSFLWADLVRPPPHSCSGLASVLSPCLTSNCDADAPPNFCSLPPPLTFSLHRPR